MRLCSNSPLATSRFPSRKCTSPMLNNAPPRSPALLLRLPSSNTPLNASRAAAKSPCAANDRPSPSSALASPRSVGARAIQLTAAAVIDNGAAEVSLDKLDVAGVDERGGEPSCVVQPLLDGQRFAKCGERVGVFELRILRGAETNERERDALVIAQFPFDGDKLLVDRLGGGEVALIVERIADVLQHIGLQLLVADSYREVERALVERLRARNRPSLRRRRRLARHGGHERGSDEIRFFREQLFAFRRRQTPQSTRRRGHPPACLRVQASSRFPRARRSALRPMTYETPSASRRDDGSRWCDRG